VAATLIGLLYTRRARALTEKDSILLSDFVNTIGDPVFDGTLKQALAVKLRESPFLNLVPESQIAETMRFMGRSPDEPAFWGYDKEPNRFPGLFLHLERCGP
jgi:eukaryotic-like serine/threonine-protein kinase